MFISSEFDAGNIKVISVDSHENIQLEISKDNNSDFYQWFYFRLSGAKGSSCTLKILNAAEAAYPLGFHDYRVNYSYDRQNWLRHPTSLHDGVLSFEFTPAQDCVYFAYFAPYAMERHHDLIASAQRSEYCSHVHLGTTLDGQDIDLLKLSNNDNRPNKAKCWLIARQHPGETMAQWWMEGVVDLLNLRDTDGGSLDKRLAELLTLADIYLVPNMNPDGSRRGHLRTNAIGRNLNREWDTPQITSCPEVFHVKNAMQKIGVDFLLDIHGDESLPYCFIAGTEGLSDWGEAQQRQLDFYKQTLVALNPDFQIDRGYPPKPPGTANMGMSTAATASIHACLAMTLEMPFKDTIDTPDSLYGWSPARSKRLAHSCLEALTAYLRSGLF